MQAVGLLLDKAFSAAADVPAGQRDAAIERVLALKFLWVKPNAPFAVWG